MDASDETGSNVKGFNTYSMSKQNLHAVRTAEAKANLLK